jgi:hypothetical protein
MKWPAARENFALAGSREVSCIFFRRKRKNQRTDFPMPVV